MLAGKLRFWLWTGLASAGLGTLLFWLALPLLQSLIGPHILQTAGLGRDPLVMAAAACSLFTLLWALVGWTTPMVHLARQLNQRAVRVSGTDIDRFNLDRTIGYGLGGWLFRQLPVVTLSVGVVLAVAALARGAAQDLQRLGDPLAALQRPMLESLFVGLTILGVAIAGALLCGIVIALGRGQIAVALNQWLERERSASSAAMQAQQSPSLTPALEALIEASDRLADVKEAQVTQLTDAVLERFLANLKGLAGTQLTGISESFQSLAAEQRTLFSAGIGELQSMTGKVETVVHTAVTSLETAGSTSQEGVSKLLAALEKEASGARTLGHAADQVAAAAQASRETVERFIALAERMRDLNRSLNTPPSAPEMLNALPRLPAKAPALRDPATRQRLSSAIRSLQQEEAAQEALPQL